MFKTMLVIGELLDNDLNLNSKFMIRLHIHRHA